MPRFPLYGLFVRHSVRRACLAVVLVLLATLISACNFGTAVTISQVTATTSDQTTATPPGNTQVAVNNVPQVQIQSPADNSQALVNTEVDVYVQATDQVGVTRIEMRADDLLVDTSASPDPNGSTSLQSLLAWTPTTSGPHVLQIVAFS